MEAVRHWKVILSDLNQDRQYGPLPDSRHRLCFSESRQAISKSVMDLYRVVSLFVCVEGSSKMLLEL